jgi:hypothetical protein
MALLNQTPNTAVDEMGGKVNQSWAQFFSQISALLTAITQTGTTAKRPTTFLWVGRPYFDTSLGAHGKPIWVASVAAGVATWVDATSAIV